MNKIYRDLNILIALCELNLTIKYRRSIFGFLWGLINPTVTIMTTSLVFSSILKVDLINYIISISFSLVGWSYLNQCLFASTTSYLNFNDLIKKIYINKIIIPFSFVISTFIDNIFFILIVLSVAFYNEFNVNIIYLLLYYFLLILFCTGCSLICASLNVFYRDFQWILNIMLQILFFMTPVLYTKKMLQGSMMGYLIEFNPISYYITGIYGSLYGKSLEYSNFLICIFVSILMMILGFIIHFSIDKEIVKRL